MTDRMNISRGSGSALSRRLLAVFLLVVGCADLAAGKRKTTAGHSTLRPMPGAPASKGKSRAFLAVVGYRYMKLDYENGDFLFDVEMSGPSVGLSFHW